MVVGLKSQKLNRLLELHRSLRVREWKRAGGRGRKPKKCDSLEVVLSRGMVHPDTLKELKR